MTEKEASYRRWEANVAIQKTKVREAEWAIELARRQAALALEEKLNGLNGNLEREKLHLKNQECSLAEAKAAFEKGFEQ